jgi:hypothetical protein
MARTLSQLEALIMEETDAMRLIGTTRAASAVIEGREKRRDDNGGFIVPPPCPVERFARARMEEPAPGRTQPFPNPEMTAMRQWLEATFEAGGNAGEFVEVLERLGDDISAGQAAAPRRVRRAL